jgi:hypothetical protein
MDDPATVAAPVSTPIQALRREISNEECLAKRMHCQELTTHAEDLSRKLLYTDLAHLWHAILRDMAEVGLQPAGACETLPLRDSPQLA